MRSILEESYPTLVEHARNVQAEVSQIPQYPIAPAQKYSLLSLIPRPFGNPVERKESQLDETDLRFRRMRWAWFALAFGGVACYVVQLCMHTVIIGADRRPRRVHTHEAGQEDQTVVSDEEGGGENEGVQDGNE
jgi:sorting and assembly machinery component 37